MSSTACTMCRSIIADGDEGASESDRLCRRCIAIVRCSGLRVGKTRHKRTRRARPYIWEQVVRENAGAPEENTVQLRRTPKVRRVSFKSPLITGPSRRKSSLWSIKPQAEAQATSQQTRVQTARACETKHPATPVSLVPITTTPKRQRTPESTPNPTPIPPRIAPTVHFSERVRRTRFFVLDTETSGLDPPQDRVLEIAIARYTPATCNAGVAPLNGLIHADWAPIDADSHSIHRISSAEVAHKPPFRVFWRRIAAYVGTTPEDDVVVLCHNAAFDAAFCTAELRRAGLPVPGYRFACTLTLARRLWPGQGATLGALAARFGVRFRAHRAAEDVRALCAVVDEMARVARARGVCVLDAWARTARPMHKWCMRARHGAWERRGDVSAGEFWDD